MTKKQEGFKSRYLVLDHEWLHKCRAVGCDENVVRCNLCNHLGHIAFDMGYYNEEKNIYYCNVMVTHSHFLTDALKGRNIRHRVDRLKVGIDALTWIPKISKEYDEKLRKTYKYKHS